jgi:hypothetical protein
MASLPAIWQHAPTSDRHTHVEAPCLTLGRKQARLAAV